MKTLTEISYELNRILEFIHTQAEPDFKIAVPVSGGLDSDVVARLCTRAVGSENVRLFTVVQEGLEEKYTNNAKNLAEDLGISLAVMHMGNMNRHLIQMMHEAAPDESFQPDSLLDPARANCSLRTAIISTYQDKGYLIPGNSNRTEIEMGFFLPFGDNLGHFKPIAHLYKSEVKMLAGLIGCRPEVISQPPSAGFWEGETDLEDMAYWLYYKGPIPGGKIFTEEDDKKVMEIQAVLSQEKIDNSLIGIHEGKTDTEIAKETGLPVSIIQTIRETKKKAMLTKNRPLLVSLERKSHAI